MMPWKLFGPNWEEVTEDWRELLNEEVRYCKHLTEYYLDNEIEDNEMGGAFGT
jgi:hypothetical protein